MTQFYLDSLFIISLGILVWGLLKRERIYQFPFIMGATFTSFILPQAFSLVNNPGLASSRAIQDVLIMSCFCAAMCWIGCSLKVNRILIKKLEFNYDKRKLLNAGIILLIFGCICQVVTLILAPNTDTDAAGRWTGPITIWYFFGQSYYIGVIILIQSLLRKPTFNKMTILLITLAPVLFRVIVGGRRSPTAGLIIILALTLFFEKNILPPRWLVATLIFLGIFLIPLFGLLRFAFWEKLFTGNLSISDLQLGLDHILRGKTLELRNAAIIMEYLNIKGDYGYGSGYWNKLVFQFVPAQIFGQGFKSSLYLNAQQLSSNFYNFTGYKIPTGSTLTGIGDSFKEFSYFGCLIFAILGYFFKNLWVSSVYYSNNFSRIVYITILYQVHWVITHGTHTFFTSNLVFNGIFLFLIKLYIYDNEKRYYVR